MKKITKTIVVIFGLVLLFSCTSNALKQEHAEKSITDFVSMHPLLTPQELVSLKSIEKISETDVFTEHRTRVNVLFKPEHAEAFSLLFIFSRTPKNLWYLESIKSDNDHQPLLTDWLSDKKHLNIPVQQ